MQRVVDDLVRVVRVRDVVEVGLTACGPRTQRIRRHVDDQPRVRRILREPGPRGDRVGAAVGVLHLHRRDGLERVRRVVAQLEDPDALPAVAVVMSGPWRAAVRIRHRPVHGHEHQIGDAVPVAVPDDRIVLVGVAREVPHQPRAGWVRDVEDPHSAARPGAGREPRIAGVVADERVLPPERQVRVRRLVGRREDLRHLPALVDGDLGERGSGEDPERDRHQQQDTGNPSHDPPPLVVSIALLHMRSTRRRGGASADRHNRGLHSRPMAIRGGPAATAVRLSPRRRSHRVGGRRRRPRA